MNTVLAANTTYKTCPRCLAIRQWNDDRSVCIEGCKVIVNPNLAPGEMYFIDYQALHKMHLSTVVES